MTEFKVGEQYIYTHRWGNDKRNGETVTITENQHKAPGFVRGEFEDGTIGTFYLDELTKKKEESVTNIKVGDTVRIKDSYPYTQGGNNVGVEFKVTEVIPDHSYHGDLGDFFVQGDPRGSGIWAKWIEKVEPHTRWRYNDHIVVYPQADNSVKGRAAVVLDENEPKVYQRWENSIAHPEGEITEAARAYWAAHPEPKPWHGAKPGEVWLLDHHNGAKVLVEAGLSDGTLVYWPITGKPGVTPEVKPADFVAGRRIYPEASE